MRQLSASLLGALCLSATAVASEDALVLDENNLDQNTDCAGRDVEVNSNNNELTFTGACRNVKVNGNNNKVSIEAAAKIQVAGNHNEVKWAKELSGKKPAISNLGKKN